MSKTSDDILAKFARDGLDGLTPDEVNLLEGLLNSRPDVAQELEPTVARPDERLAAALQADEQLPSDAAWQNVWDKVETGAAPVATPGSRTLRLWRVLAPVTAAAACLVMVLMWQFGGQDTGADEFWPLSPGGTFEIHEIETYGDATFLIAAGGEESVDVIWVLEQES